MKTTPSRRISQPQASKMLNALKVITLTEGTYKYLKANDPQVLKQAMGAIPLYLVDLPQAEAYGKLIRGEPLSA